MKVKFGQYTGNGSDGRTVTGVGFQPNLVLVKDQNANNGMFRTSVMGANQSLSLREDSGAITTGIKSLDSDGFTLGTDNRVNSTSDVYNYIAIQDDGAGDFKVGSYTGNGVDNHAITGVGFQPIALFVKGDLGRTGCAMFSTQPANHASLFFSGADELNTALRSLNSDGFTTGSGDKANNNTTTYYYFAFKSVAAKTQTVTFTGNGTDGRIVASNFQVGWAYLKADAGINASFRTPNFAANTSQIGWDQSTGTTAIKSFGTSSITLGTDATANQNTTTYYGFFLYDPTAVTTIPNKVTQIKQAVNRASTY